MTRHKTDSEVIYRSNVRVTVLSGAMKSVSLPAESAPVRMGLHGALAEHYKLSAAAFEPCASTLDYIVGATAGCLMGTLERTLAGYKVPTTGGRLQLEAEGQIEIEEGVLVTSVESWSWRISKRKNHTASVQSVLWLSIPLVVQSTVPCTRQLTSPQN
jgi:hypothetical protein